jgi:membrane-associated phospholipid phosphatase
VALLNACGSDKAGPTGLSTSVVDVAGTDVRAAAALLSPVWQKTARDYVADAKFSPIAAGHAYPLLGVAQYLALQQAEAAIGASDNEDSKSSGNGVAGRSRLETDRGAVAGASAAVLTYLFPTKASVLEDMVTAQANAGSGQPHPAFTAAVAIGRAVGAEIVARAKVDGFSAPNTVTVPVGDGLWISSTNPASKPAGGQLPGVTRWFLESASQFRPGPPPEFGKPVFNAALAEIRTMADTSNDEMKRIAGAWALNPGTYTASGFWLDHASTEIVKRGLSERKATHIFALLSATMADAAVGCWDAKLTYWLIRPWNADTHIHPLASMGTPPPNHPSYPSGHSCVSSSGAAVLAAFFPDKQRELDAMVTEAGLSRMYGGIHYRFDCETGQALGRNVARFAIRADRSGHSVLTPPEHDDGQQGGDD